MKKLISVALFSLVLMTSCSHMGMKCGHGNKCGGCKTEKCSDCAKENCSGDAQCPMKHDTAEKKEEVKK